MITDRHLIMIAFITMMIMTVAISDYNKRLYLLEDENKKITSHLEIMQYALGQKGLIIWKDKK